MGVGGERERQAKERMKTIRWERKEAKRVEVENDTCMELEFGQTQGNFLLTEE